MEYRVAVCGSATLGDDRAVQMIGEVLNYIGESRRITGIIRPASPGAAEIAGAWAEWAGIPCRAVGLLGFDPRLDLIVRNEAILKSKEELKTVDALIAFPVDADARTLVDRALELGIPVLDAGRLHEWMELAHKLLSEDKQSKVGLLAGAEAYLALSRIGAEEPITDEAMSRITLLRQQVAAQAPVRGSTGVGGWEAVGSAAGKVWAGIMRMRSAFSNASQ